MLGNDHQSQWMWPLGILHEGALCLERSASWSVVTVSYWVGFFYLHRTISFLNILNSEWWSSNLTWFFYYLVKVLISLIFGSMPCIDFGLWLTSSQNLSAIFSTSWSINSLIWSSEGWSLLTSSKWKCKVQGLSATDLGSRLCWTGRTLLIVSPPTYIEE